MEIAMRRQRLHQWMLWPAIFLFAGLQGWPQAPLATIATEPYRFIGAHGRRAGIFGYAGRSLEIWGYPFQILDRYTVDFRLQGSPEFLKGSSLLSRVVVALNQTTRVWTGPGFEVRETEFAPLDEPDAMLRYQVTGTSPVEIVVRWRPELNLMWPASAGGQGIEWSDALHGYVVSESTYGYRAVVASPEIAEHAPIVNATRRQTLTQSFTLRPRRQSGGESTAAVYVSLVPPGGANPQAVLNQLVTHAAQLRGDAEEASRQWKADALAITTPDVEVNRAVAWADTDLEQAWACDPRIGCGAVAGFGPSRPMRRPQYDWFFAGDGMIAAEAMLAAGHAERAREELDFLFRYQNADNGMMWHEISQSAGFLDWAGKYPYLYPHVDLTFQFLSFLGSYYAETGDLDLLNRHWAAIQAAFHFCRSLLSPQTGLPLIPAGKMGADEQDRMTEDAGLSAAWVSAAESYAQLARATRHTQQADAAATAGKRARDAYAARYWNAKEHFWMSGYTASGPAMSMRRSGPTSALTQHLLSSAEQDEMLDSLSGAAFETDWGTRSLAADSPQYDPDSYSKGSVSALHTAETAMAFWSAHRPLEAWQIWSGLIPWTTMDSPGYMEEVITGRIFQPQVESVPQQTWSSAGLLSATVRGLLGISVDAPDHRLTLAPHRFPGGGVVKFEHLRAAGALVSASFEWQEQSVEAKLTNDGRPIQLDLAPEMPLGATGARADVNGKRTANAIRTGSGEQQYVIQLLLPHGVTDCRFQYAGGVWIEVARARPQPGASSRSPRIRKVGLQGRELTIQADIRAGATSSLIVETPWRIADVEGGSATELSPRRSQIEFAPVSGVDDSEGYLAATLRVRFKPAGGRRERGHGRQGRAAPVE